MAGYREHISVSGILGVGVAAAGTMLLGFTFVQSAIAGVLCWIAGMLPDLDSESGKPVRELFGITAAITPLALMQRLNSLGGDTERAMLLALIVYGIVRYGGATLLGRLSVHRGMFHSIPALLIASQVTFLGYYSPDLKVKALMGAAVGIGFLSHLILDEMYSVQWNGARIKLSKSAGSAMKFFGKESLPNAIATGLLMFFTYAVLVESGIVMTPGEQRAPEILQMTSELPDAPLFNIAEGPGTSERR